MTAPTHALAGDAWRTDVERHEGVPFRETPQLDLELEFFDPAEARDTAVVYVHGGGWRAARRGHLTGYADSLASRGYPGVCVDHRSSDMATFPGPVVDVKAGIQWARRATDVWPDTPERIAVVGASSGAHLAGFAAVTGDGPAAYEPDAGESTAVDAAALLYPPLDLRELVRNRREENPEAEDGAPVAFVGADYATDPQAYDEASPVTYLEGDSPPFLLLHGDEDEVVPMNQSLLFRERCRELGVPVHLDVLEGIAHGFSTDSPWEERTLGEIELFLGLAPSLSR